MSFRPSLYPTIATALGLALLISLGTWQFQQFQQKRALEREKAGRADKPVVDVYGTKAFNDKNLGHRRVRLHGRLFEKTRIVFESRFRDGEPGVWLASPVELRDGGFVVVNRGWIPFQAAKGKLPQNLQTPPLQAAGSGEQQTYLGVAHPLDRPIQDVFMRKQIADGEITVWRQETRWESVDIPGVTDALKSNLSGSPPDGAYLVSLTQQHSGDPYPKASADQKVQKYLTAGRHLGYAVFWFVVAAALIGMYIASGFGVLGSFARGQRKE